MVNIGNIGTAGAPAAAVYMGGAGGVDSARAALARGFARTAVNMVNEGNIGGPILAGRDLFYLAAAGDAERDSCTNSSPIWRERWAFSLFSFAKDARFCDGAETAAAPGERRGRDVHRDVHRAWVGGGRLAAALDAECSGVAGESLSLLENSCMQEANQDQQNKVEGCLGGARCSHVHRAASVRGNWHKPNGSVRWQQ